VKNTIDVQVSDAEMERRRSLWSPREPKVKQVSTSNSLASIEPALTRVSSPGHAVEVLQGRVERESRSDHGWTVDAYFDAAIRPRRLDPVVTDGVRRAAPWKMSRNCVLAIAGLEQRTALVRLPEKFLASPERTLI
jgi:hypothetical protein